MFRSRVAVAAVMVGAALTACGGGGADADDPAGRGASPPAPAAADGVPLSATVSPAAFTAYVAGLSPSEGSEPLSTRDLVPPVSDGEEPDEP